MYLKNFNFPIYKIDLTLPPLSERGLAWRASVDLFVSGKSANAILLRMFIKLHDYNLSLVNVYVDCE